MKIEQKYFSVQCSPIPGRALVFGRFPGFALILPVTAKRMKMRMGHWCNDIQGKTTGKKTCPSDTTFSTNVTRTGLRLNKGLREERPNNGLRHSTALNLEINTDRA